MDTREKIVSTEAAVKLLQEPGWIAVVGRFDPMTAEEAARLADFAERGKVLGIVLDDPESLLPAEGRALLVASLRAVSAVLVITRERWESSLSPQTAIPAMEDHEGERARRGKFIQTVLARLQQQ